MSDQQPESPQDADLTQTVSTSSTPHRPAHEPGGTAWTTWVPASEQHHAPAPSWSPPPVETLWTPPLLPESTTSQTTSQTTDQTADQTTDRTAHQTVGVPATPPPPAPTQALAPTHEGTARQAPPQVTYLPPPSGPNSGLVVVGMIFALIGAGVVANQVTGFQVASLSELGPSVLVVAGLACALLGMIGIVTRRRRG